MRRWWKLLALAWFWIAVAGIVVTGFWPGATWASILVWACLSIGLVTLFELGAVLFIDLPRRRRLAKLR